MDFQMIPSLFLLLLLCQEIKGQCNTPYNEEHGITLNKQQKRFTWTIPCESQQLSTAKAFSFCLYSTIKTYFTDIKETNDLLTTSLSISRISLHEPKTSLLKKPSTYRTTLPLEIHDFGFTEDNRLAACYTFSSCNIWDYGSTFNCDSTSAPNYNIQLDLIVNMKHPYNTKVPTVATFTSDGIHLTKELPKSQGIGLPGLLVTTPRDVNLTEKAVTFNILNQDYYRRSFMVYKTPLILSNKKTEGTLLQCVSHPSDVGEFVGYTHFYRRKNLCISRPENISVHFTKIQKKQKSKKGAVSFKLLKKKDTSKPMRKTTNIRLLADDPAITPPPEETTSDPTDLLHSLVTEVATSSEIEYSSYPVTPLPNTDHTDLQVTQPTPSVVTATNDDASHIVTTVQTTKPTVPTQTKPTTTLPVKVTTKILAGKSSSIVTTKKPGTDSIDDVKPDSKMTMSSSSTLKPAEDKPTTNKPSSTTATTSSGLRPYLSALSTFLIVGNIYSQMLH